jgi:hypothetical protein
MCACTVSCGNLALLSTCLCAAGGPTPRPRTRITHACIAAPARSRRLLPPLPPTPPHLAQAATASRPSWFPGSKFPAHLDGSLPGDHGFDPFNLGVDPAKLKWYQQAELVHCRFAMLGAAGILVPDLFHSIGLGGPAAQVRRRRPWLHLPACARAASAPPHPHTNTRAGALVRGWQV